MPQCPNECQAAPVLTKETGRLHGDTTRYWKCPTCGERWTTTVAGIRGLIGATPLHAGAATVHTLTVGAHTSITMPRYTE